MKIISVKYLQQYRPSIIEIVWALKTESGLFKPCKSQIEIRSIGNYPMEFPLQKYSHIGSSAGNDRSARDFEKLAVF
jgi:hypothetical protein